MLGDWQNWCRLCAKTDSTGEDSWYKAESIREQLDIVSKHFKISIEPYKDEQQSVQPLICAECYDLLAKLGKFKRRCFKTDEMFKRLTWVKYFSDPQLQALRTEYAVDTDEEKCIENNTQLPVPQSTARTKTKENLGRDDKETRKKLFVVCHNQEKAYIVVPYEGDELEYDDFVRKACSYLKVQEITTIYDQKKIKIDAESFKFVLEKNPPEYLIVKEAYSSTNSTTDSSKIPEDSVQCYSVSDQSSDTNDMEIGESFVVKQETPEVTNEPSLKVRRLELLQTDAPPTSGLLFRQLPDSPLMQNNDFPEFHDFFSTDEPLNAASLPNANFNMNFFGIHLKDIMNCPDGHRIISFYKARGDLDRTRRDLLITLILDYSDQRGIHLSCKILEALSEEIQQMFPSEPKEYYYTPKNAFQKSYSGILYARYHNRRRSVKKRQEVEMNHSLVQKPDPPQPTCPMEKLKQLKMILSTKQNEDISPEIIEMWNKCFFIRKGDFVKKDNAILEWPLLSKINGYVLIFEDFAQWNATTQALNRKWKEFHDNIVPVLKMYIKDRQNRQTLDDLIDYVTDEETKQSTIFLLLHSVLKPRGFLRQPDPIDPTKIKYIRPTITDAQESMLITLDSEQQLESRVATFESHLQETGRKFHPIIFRIKNGGYHVYCYRGLKYQIQTLKEAIDICFKSFHTIHPGDYPLESEVVWYFIQTYFYEMKTSSDARFVGSCVDIINQLNRAAHSKVIQINP